MIYKCAAQNTAELMLAPKPTAQARAEHRQKVAIINNDLRRFGEDVRIGRFLRLERNHHFGLMAIYAMERVPEVEGQIA